MTATTRPAAVVETTVTVPADDGYPLAGTWYTPAQDSGHAPITIVAAATAVERRYYARFARFLAAAGRPTLTFDYRGIGGSLIGPIQTSRAAYRDWGVLDTPGAIGFAARQYPGRNVHWVGHSYGGFAPGLAHNNTLISRWLGVATMSADIRLLDPSFELVRIAVLLQVLGPALAYTVGYVPAGIAGNTPLPKQVLLGWSKWCRTKDFLFGDPTLDDVRVFQNVRAPVRLTLIADDKWVSRRGVTHLLERFTGSVERSIWEIPAPSGGPEIGHVGFFRDAYRDTLWRDALVWLDG